MTKAKQGVTYRIEPSIGLARVGDSLSHFYLAPERIGGRPIDCDEHGNAKLASGVPVPVKEYKDAEMRVKRQGARFQVIRQDGERTEELTLDSADVESIEWTVHVANKKAAWYSFSELLGNLWYTGTYTPSNSYDAHKVELRNPDVSGTAERKKLIIDPGPRTLSGRRQDAKFSRDTIPVDYPHGSFPEYGPDGPKQGYPINTLGSAVTDNAGRLVVIGAYGRAGGNEPISSYGGANTWHDDIADGTVSCKLTLRTREVIELDAWVIVGSPKFAPELVNITTVDDVVYDVGVRYHNLDPALYSKTSGYNPSYMVSFEDDIQPILDRMASYQWVANVQSMTAAARPGFDVRDPSEANRRNRESLQAQVRGQDTSQVLWAANRSPAVPLNSGTNSVSNQHIVKFSSLTRTQEFFMAQWAEGKFTPGPRPTQTVSPRDRADIGNATGEPMSPGIEVTWSVRNPTLYDRPYHVKLRHDAAFYRSNGLSPTEDETVPMTPSAVVGNGCEPGDLTKRMAIPWQADFFQCTLQYVNFTNPAVNKVNGIPLPPTYYAYWWPPQSPWDVLNGAHTEKEQAATGLPAGIQVNYARGINSFVDMITGWKYLGFIHNVTEGQHRDWYPYFVEVERNDDRFTMASVAIGGISNVVDPTNVTFAPAWFLSDSHEADSERRVRKLRSAALTESVGSEPDDVLPKPITAHPHLGLPRNGRVIR